MTVRTREQRWGGWTVAAILATAGAARGQAPAIPPPPAGITLNFPDNVPVKTLVDYVSARLNINIVYDDELLKKAGTVTVRAPNAVTPAELLAFLSGVLETKGDALVDDGPAGGAGHAGWKRVVAVASVGAPSATVVEAVRLASADASKLAPQVKQLVAAEAANGSVPDAGRLQVSFDQRTNQLILAGSASAVTEAVHIARLIDVPVSSEQNPSRLTFYKLTNATAADVLDTIRDLEGRPPSARPRPATPARNDISSAFNSPTGGNGTGGSGSGGGGTQSGSAYGQATQGSAGNSAMNVSRPAPVPPTGGGGATDNAIQPTGAGGTTAGLGQEAVTADTNTNTIIVRGGPDVQRTYAELIRTLDKRRPQVLLEATVVTLDTTDNFTFGVELAAHSNGATKFLSFSQFGLSTVDVATGSLTPNVNTGGTAAVVGTGVANAVIQALVQNSHARVQSAPRVLVNDNATGLLASIAEQPFTSVNASTTVATTSFGGYADAGTTISLTPHISEGDYLQLEYAVELSSFTGTGDAATGSPPPRQTDRVESKVTIPDGTTIIVGGLNRKQFTRDLNAVPILGQIPILEYLFSSRNHTASTSTLFVFLRPTILRDEQFMDLRNLSEGDLKNAGIPTNFPQSAPVIMR